MKLFEVATTEKVAKAGFMPFVIRKGVPVYLFMISSDGKFGGDEAQIAKGHIDAGETAATAAVREAEEELGLRKSNLLSSFKGWSGSQTGLKSKYPFTVFAGQVKSKKAFNKPHYETKATLWLSAEEFGTTGRDSQRHIVEAVDKVVRASLQSS